MHGVIENGQRVAGSVKREGSNLVDSKFSYDREDIWVVVNSMEAFTIAVLGFAAVVEELFFPHYHCFAILHSTTRSMTAAWSSPHSSSCSIFKSCATSPVFGCS